MARTQSWSTSLDERPRHGGRHAGAAGTSLRLLVLIAMCVVLILASVSVLAWHGVATSNDLDHLGTELQRLYDNDAQLRDNDARLEERIRAVGCDAAATRRALADLDAAFDGGLLASPLPTTQEDPACT